MQKRPSNHFLSFTQKERRAIIFLLVIIAVLWMTPFFYALIFENNKIITRVFANELDSLRTMPTDREKSTTNSRGEFPGKYIDESSRKNHFDDDPISTPFNFDPNILGAEGWKKLGLRDKTITGIQHYLAKGGKFRQPADIKKIWGLQAGLAERLLPFVKIENSKDQNFRNNPFPPRSEYTKKSIQILNINQADSQVLVSLPGIGPGYTSRILKYRDRLGGFHSINQVSETFGLPDSVFQKMKGYLLVNGNDVIRKININTATLDELKDHPYIRYQLANAIIQFRNQHGSFTEVSDIKKIMLVTDEIFGKISMYLSVQ